MKRRFDAEGYLRACGDGKKIIEFCHEHKIHSFDVLVDSINLFPEEKKDEWFKRLTSPGFIRFLHSKGIK